jgi:hypothetical protein
MHTSAESEAPKTSRAVPDDNRSDGRRAAGRAQPAGVLTCVRSDDRVRSRERLALRTVRRGVADVAAGALAVRSGSVEAAGPTSSTRVAGAVDLVTCVVRVPREVGTPAFRSVTRVAEDGSTAEEGGSSDGAGAGVGATDAPGAAGAESTAGATLVVAGA